jgi:hypothetical protein
MFFFMALLEEVFKLNGVPTYTFVRPNEFNRLLVALRTPGRGIVLEGPSGIGKTTAITKALQELGSTGLSPALVELSARRKEDLEYIENIESIGYAGIVIIDDFHRLTQPQQSAIADYLKVLADKEDTTLKIVVVGINNAGARLVDIAPDLHARVELIRLEANSDERVEQLVELGEQALHVCIGDKKKLVENARGSFYIAQMLSHETCLQGGVLESRTDQHFVAVSIELVKTRIYDRLRGRFQSSTKTFARGMKFQRDGRAPYFLLLRWLAESSDWSINLTQELMTHQDSRASVSQVIEKGFLEQFMQRNDDLFGKLLHFDVESKILTVEDPQFLFYLRETIWPDLATEAGFTNPDRSHPIDFALSFAGPQRNIAELFATKLIDNQLNIFYDKFEESRIVAEDVEEYLRPIYQTRSQFVVVILSNEYPTRIWTKFESDSFKARFRDGAVIPVILSYVTVDTFSVLFGKGYIRLDLHAPVQQEVDRIVTLLIEKLRESISM